MTCKYTDWKCGGRKTKNKQRKRGSGPNRRKETGCVVAWMRRRRGGSREEEGGKKRQGEMEKMREEGQMGQCRLGQA